MMLKSQYESIQFFLRQNIDPKPYNIITWKWKGPKTINRGDVFKIEGYDYPASQFITSRKRNPDSL